MARERILIVEDDENIAELISYNLKKDHYEVVLAESGEEALAKVGNALPDLVLLDLMLPEIDGLEVCKRLRLNTSTRDVPVIMVTAKGEEADVVTGLELGAEDYITKPFRPRELIARVKAVLRRTSEHSTEADPAADIKLFDIEIRPGRREVLVYGEPVSLTYTEFEVLHLLARRPGWVFTRYQIVDAVRGEDYPVTDRSVDVQIVGLRKKLGKAGSCIDTVRGIGYRLKDTDK